jgi:hypothetical protein
MSSQHRRHAPSSGKCYLDMRTATAESLEPGGWIISTANTVTAISSLVRQQDDSSGWIRHDSGSAWRSQHSGLSPILRRLRRSIQKAYDTSTWNNIGKPHASPPRHDVLQCRQSLCWATATHYIVHRSTNVAIAPQASRTSRVLQAVANSVSIDVNIFSGKHLALRSWASRVRVINRRSRKELRPR